VLIPPVRVTLLECVWNLLKSPLWENSLLITCKRGKV